MRSALYATFLCLLWTATVILGSQPAKAQTYGIRKYSRFNKAPVAHKKIEKKGVPLLLKKKLFANYVREYISFGIAAHGLNYMGDIAPEPGFFTVDYSLAKLGMGMSMAAQVNARTAFRTELMYGKISSSDFEVANPLDPQAVYRYIRNLHFKNSIKEISLIGSYDFIANNRPLVFRPVIAPYAFTGLTFFHHNPKALVPMEATLSNGETIIPEQAGTWVALRPLKTEGQSKPYSNFQISIPIGMGLRMRVSDIVNLETELGYRYLFTDYLDDVSGNYPDKGSLDSDLARILSDRSQEVTDALTGEIRRDRLPADSPLMRRFISYTGADGRVYTVFSGYGQPNQIRGNPKLNDGFLVTSMRLSIILGKSPIANKNSFRKWKR